MTMPANKIYTRTGDNGLTSLGNSRISKTHPLMDVMGKLDDLQAALGLAEVLVRQQIFVPSSDSSPCLITTAEIKNEAKNGMSDAIIEIQEYLYEFAGSIHQNYKKKTRSLIAMANGGDSLAFDLEEKMDIMNEELPKLTHFIRPGGKDMAVAQLHVCRTVCRDLERKLHIASKDESCLLKQDAIDLNRMSDWLFVLGRYYHKIMYPKEEECLFIHKK